ncbi:hypothetical protein DPMN_160298 [Dreissena polymorpha]|uniref:Uncharacterized protein n=1 Tax=Dreissena polymorpha TaxID=45954 RepID=A0A9D4EN74_DREPO|nr:hypothetical protein DPMN_160298 [Dreissena polymorpha]
MKTSMSQEKRWQQIQQHKKRLRDDDRLNNNNRNNNAMTVTSTTKTTGTTITSLDVNLETQTREPDRVNLTGLSSSRQRYTRLESNSEFSTCHSHIQLGNVPIFFTVEPT